jgi:hypothetical protein
VSATAAEQAVIESGRHLTSDLPTDQRWHAARARGYELAADAGIDAYGTRVLPIGGGAS